MEKQTIYDQKTRRGWKCGLPNFSSNETKEVVSRDSKETTETDKKKE